MPHGHDDRELLGWIRPAGEELVAVDRLGHDVTGAGDWLAAEEALDERELRWLAEWWSPTLDDGTEQRVRFAEVSPERVVVVAEHRGAELLGTPTWTLPFPAPDTLRPIEGDAHVDDA